MHNQDLQAALPACDEVSCEKQNRLGLITLNRPGRRNAISHEMRQKITAAFKIWVDDPDIYTILFKADDEQFFSSGSDVKQIYEASKHSRQQALDLFREIYEFIWTIECYTKPVISIINAAVMGGGVGLTQSGTHIIAGENYSWSMPEAKLGLFPDVAVTHQLARMPGETGKYLGLTGHSVNRYDALYLGLLEFCIDADQFETIIEAQRYAEPVDSLLDRIKQNPATLIEKSEIKSRQALITSVFSKPTIEEIIKELEQLTSGDEKQAEWAKSVLKDLSDASPISLKITLKAIERAKSMELHQVLEQDYNLAHHILDDPDFLGAVEAKLVNKTAPVWQPAELSDVSETITNRYFQIISEDKLNLPPRELGVDQ